jgi:hypothetical protein
VHEPDGHDAVAPVAGVQATQVAPHWVVLLATHAPLMPQAFWPVGHWHIEPEHCLPPVQALAQPPQLLESVWKLTQALLHGE